jgi:rubrerythrin
MSHLTKMILIKTWLLLAAVCLLLGPGNQGLLAGTYLPAENGRSTSLENLLTAYQMESNSYNLYQAFSQKAESEGHPGVAHLFRAVMFSVKVQMDNHAEAIKKMKGTPQSKPVTPEVHSTRENLQRALKDASAKFNDFYPVFLQQARKERERDALRTFNFAKSAAEAQIKFLSEASSQLETWEKEKRNFWVCTVCGHMVTKIDFTECPICFNPVDKYTQVK